MSSFWTNYLLLVCEVARQAASGEITSQRSNRQTQRNRGSDGHWATRGSWHQPSPLSAGDSSRLARNSSHCGRNQSAAAEPIAEVAIEPHGAELRGLDLVLESPTAEGRFGYMFKNQPPLAASEDLLSALGQTMEERPVIGTNLTDPETGEPVLNSDGSPWWRPRTTTTPSAKTPARR